MRPSIPQGLRSWARTIKHDVVALYLAAVDPRVPRLAKIVAFSVAAYALSPIDLIPDFIPILGYLDDLVILPLGIMLAVKLVPADLMSEFRATAVTQWTRSRPGQSWRRHHRVALDSRLRSGRPLAHHIMEKELKGGATLFRFVEAEVPANRNGEVLDAGRRDLCAIRISLKRIGRSTRLAVWSHGANLACSSTGGCVAAAGGGQRGRSHGIGRHRDDARWHRRLLLRASRKRSGSGAAYLRSTARLWPESADFLAAQACRRLRIVTIVAPGRMAEVNDGVAVVGDDGVVERRATRSAASPGRSVVRGSAGPVVVPGR